MLRYWAGEYAEADSLRYGGYRRLRDQTTITLTFHAMTKAKLNDRDAAGELLTMAKEAFKKAVLDYHGSVPGDYGENWWDRLVPNAACRGRKA